MKIIAALCWFDERPEILARCVSSLAGVVDSVVALDGPWEGFPAEGLLRSPDEQSAAIDAAADAAGLPLRAGHGAEAWPSQVAKRSELMRVAALAGDWILVVDADEYVERCDPEALRRVLAETEHDVAEARMRNAGQGVRNISAFGKRRLFRSASGVTLERAHNGYRAADGRWLYGDRRHVDLAPAADVSGYLELVNDVSARPRRRADAAAVYYQARALAGEWAAA